MTWLIRQIGHLVLSAPDPMASAEDLNQAVGLRITEMEGDTVYLSSNDRHHEVTYVKGAGEAVCLGLEAVSAAAVDEVLGRHVGRAADPRRHADRPRLRPGGAAGRAGRVGVRDPHPDRPQPAAPPDHPPCGGLRRFQFAGAPDHRGKDGRPRLRYPLAGGRCQAPRHLGAARSRCRAMVQPRAAHHDRALELHDDGDKAGQSNSSVDTAARIIRVPASPSGRRAIAPISPCR